MDSLIDRDIFTKRLSMIEIHYLDAYKQERIQTFENKDAPFWLLPVA